MINVAKWRERVSKVTSYNEYQNIAYMLFINHGETLKTLDLYDLASILAHNTASKGDLTGLLENIESRQKVTESMEKDLEVLQKRYENVLETIKADKEHTDNFNRELVRELDKKYKEEKYMMTRLEEVTKENTKLMKIIRDNNLLEALNGWK